MALVIEDGTGKPDADSYVSVADCEAYAAANNLTFAGTESEQEGRLRRATRYLDTEYQYKGQESTETQALAWPRDVAPGVIPKQIKDACCELACKAGDLWADVDPRAIVSQTVGPISTTYAEPVNGGQKRFAAVDSMLRCWIDGRGLWSVPVVRA